MVRTLRCDNCGWTEDISDAWGNGDIEYRVLEHIRKCHVSFESDPIKEELVVSYMDTEETVPCIVCQKYFKKGIAQPMEIRLSDNKCYGYICPTCQEHLFSNAVQNAKELDAKRRALDILSYIKEGELRR